VTLDLQLSPLNDEEEMILFTIIAIEYLLNSPTLKNFERNILKRRLLRYLERLGEIHLDEPETKR